jgi:PhnB protein
MPRVLIQHNRFPSQLPRAAADPGRSNQKGATSMVQQKTRVKPIPEGHHTITPHLVVRGGAEAIAFYKKAFGAEELGRSPGPDGMSIMHAGLKIGDSILFLNDEFPDMGCRSPQALGGSPITLHLYVKDVDAVFKQAVAAGAQVRMPVTDMFWGDRYGQVTDPFGHVWALATHIEDLTREEIEKRANTAFCEPPVAKA